MPKQSHDNTTPTTGWETWEDLLLSCAVHRYGTDSWDSIAAELQNRIPSLKPLTPQTCKHKYYDLKRRFATRNDVVPSATTNNHHNNKNNTKTATAIPWLDELRQLRVAELRREVERYDLSIVSLQLKVKRLKEESEEGDRETEKSDLRKEAIKSERDQEDDVKRRVQENLTSSEDSDRENRSVNGSNSTDPKTDSQGEAEKGPELVEPAGLDGPEREKEFKVESEGRGGEELCNSATEVSAGNSVRVEPGDSAAGSSKGGKECNSSDVQSSASLSRKAEEEEDGDEKKGKEAEGEGGRCCNGSQPLIEFLEIIRSHKLGSILERRLETQKTSKYNKLIRQHMDFKIIRTRLGEGWYSGSNRKFFRDLLLLINNAIIFFAKKSSESLAAIELRKLVSKELALMRSSSSPTDASPTEESIGPEDPGPSRSLPEKPKMRVRMVACRKRSSVLTKASPVFSGTAKKGEQKASVAEEKPVVEMMQQDKSTDKAEENWVAKKRTRERFSSSTRSSNKNSYKSSRTSVKTNRNSEANSITTSSSTKAGSQKENTESKVEKEKKNIVNATSSKKKGAANFLDRMKRSSPSSNNKPLVDSVKRPVSNSDNSRSAMQRKSNNSRNDAKKDQNTAKRSGAKDQNTVKNSGAKDQNTSSGAKPATREARSSAKRNPPGRPLKRAAASPAPLVVPAKRGRESSAAEAGASKKRSRRDGILYL